MSLWFRQPLTTKIFLGMILGMLFGWVCYLMGWSIGKDIRWLGDIFIRLIQVVIVPLVFAVLTVAMANVDLKSFGRMGVKVLVFYTMTTIVATILGVSLAYLVQPGAGLDPNVLGKGTPPQATNPPGLGDIMLGMIPTNVVDAMAKSTMIQVVVFSMLAGLIMGNLGKKAEPVKVVLESVYAIMVRMIWVIMEYAPYGVFALMSWLMATTGFAALVPLAKYILTLIGGVLFQTFIVTSIFIGLIARVNPIQFYKRSIDYMVVAFTTRSSQASLPVALQVAEQKLGIRPEVAGFSLPLGAVMNQDGSAIWWPLAAMFIAQFYGIQVTFDQMVNLVILVNLIGLGSTGIPSGGLILLAMILQGMGWPVEGIALIVGVDAIPDMFRTTLNVVDDLSGALMIAATEKGMFDKEVFYGRKEVIPEEIDLHVEAAS